ncbi:MAG: hypothetical protein IJC71_02870 [Clostridia bacterium]|nr:hypothetical protein [Clostridia bacterium]
MNEKLTNILKTKADLRLKDGKFKILTFGSLFAGKDNCEEIRGAIEKYLEQTNPDLVFFNGNVTTGIPSKDELKAVLDVITAPIVSRGILWAHVFGDRDSRNGLPNSEAMEVYDICENCISIAGDFGIDGCSNYVLPIMGEGEKPEICIYCFDTHQEIGEYEKKYGSPTRGRLANTLYGEHYMDGVRFNQSMFYWDTSCELEAAFGAKVPAMFMFHTPIPEFGTVIMNQSRAGFKGYQYQWMRGQVVAGGLFEAAIERREAKAIICAHADGNHFTGTYARILFAQARDMLIRGSAAALLVEVRAGGEVSAELL